MQPIPGIPPISRLPLIECHLLDPRPAAQAVAAPIADAVNIPLPELPQRTHELPPREELLPVAGPAAVAQQAMAWLMRHGRRAAAAASFQHANRSAGRAIGRLWRPSAFLAEVLTQLPPGAALDLACGCGRDAVYLASCGWRVTAIDILPDAIARAADLARRCAPAILPIDWVVADVEEHPPDFDRLFDLVLAIRYLHRPLLARLASWLKPDGSVLCETFTTLHRQRHGKPAADAHVLTPGELPTLLAGLEIRHYSEEWRGTAHTAQVWARKTSGVAYRVSGNG